jgi:hypothetical protein
MIANSESFGALARLIQQPKSFKILKSRIVILNSAMLPKAPGFTSGHLLKEGELITLQLTL